MSTPSGPFRADDVYYDYVDVFFSVANAETPVAHGLAGRFLGWTVVRKFGYGDITEGQMPPASNVVHLQCDTAGVTATIRVEALRSTQR